MITQIAHLCLSSTNLAKTEHFYCTALGLKRHFRFLKNGKEFGFYLHAGNQTFIEVFEQNQIVPNEQAPIRHLCLQVTNLDQFIATIRSHGYQVGDKKIGADQSWQAWLNDPDGVRIELHEYTANSSQTTGHDCVC